MKKLYLFLLVSIFGGSQILNCLPAKQVREVASSVAAVSDSKLLKDVILSSDFGKGTIFGVAIAAVVGGSLYYWFNKSKKDYSKLTSISKSSKFFILNKLSAIFNANSDVAINDIISWLKVELNSSEVDSDFIRSLKMRLDTELESLKMIKDYYSSRQLVSIDVDNKTSCSPRFINDVIRDSRCKDGFGSRNYIMCLSLEAAYNKFNPMLIKLINESNLAIAA